MALRIVESAGVTDVGRQRHTNEDAYFSSGRVFAVADGMGGAKAGEVASRIAVEAFEEERDAGRPPEAQLAEVAQAANRRIYELAQRDESRRGMGTTLTAAMVSGREVSIGHVGDSRAYRLRDGTLEQLTRDHSLVAELERRGELSPEDAEQHPQRSIITRALGPEPEVEVDTYTDHGRDGDVYLLCSDGLTAMVSEDEVAGIVRTARSLEEAGDELVRAANQSGGKDNITVVLFRLGGDGEEQPDEDTLSGRETSVALRAEDVRAEAERRAAGRRAGSSAVAGAPPASAAHDTVGVPRARSREHRLTRQASSSAPPAGPRRRRGSRRALTAAAGLLALGVVAAALYLGARQVYFVGTDEAGLVTLHRGLPYELPLGVRLYSEDFVTSVPAGSLPPRRREHILDHELRSRSDAVDLVRQVERDRVVR